MASSQKRTHDVMDAAAAASADGSSAKRAHTLPPCPYGSKVSHLSTSQPCVSDMYSFVQYLMRLHLFLYVHSYASVLQEESRASA
jgi:hypothetical protein